MIGQVVYQAEAKCTVHIIIFYNTLHKQLGGGDPPTLGIRIESSHMYRYESPTDVPVAVVATDAVWNRRYSLGLWAIRWVKERYFSLRGLQSIDSLSSSRRQPS